MEKYRKAKEEKTACLQELKKSILAQALSPQKGWKMVTLGEVCDIYQPKTITSKEIQKDGKYKVFGANGIIGRFDNYNHEDAEVAVTCRGATCGNVNFTEPKSWITGNAMVVKPKNKDIDKPFLFYLLQNSDLKSVISGSAQPQITRKKFSSLKIPLPPLEEQKQIVAKIDAVFTEIDKAHTHTQYAIAESESFKTALLTQAFKGNLVAAASVCG